MPLRPLATSDDVAEYLGVPRHTLDDWVYRKVGPKYVKVGRRRRYCWHEVERRLEKNNHGGEAA